METVRFPQLRKVIINNWKISDQRKHVDLNHPLQSLPESEYDDYVNSITFLLL